MGGKIKSVMDKSPTKLRPRIFASDHSNVQKKPRRG